MTDREEVEYNGEPCYLYPGGMLRSRRTGRIVKAGEAGRFAPGDRRTRAAAKAGADARAAGSALARGPLGSRRAVGPPSSKRAAGRGPGVPAGPVPEGLAPLVAAMPEGVRLRLASILGGEAGPGRSGGPQDPGSQGAEGANGSPGDGAPGGPGTWGAGGADGEANDPPHTSLSDVLLGSGSPQPEVFSPPAGVQGPTGDQGAGEPEG